MKNAFSIFLIGTALFFANATTRAQTPSDFLPSESVFDTLSADLKINGKDGPVEVAVGERITISWESEGAKRCKGNWSRNDLKLNGKITGRLGSSVVNSIIVRIACIDADGNREDDSVALKITGSTPPPFKNPVNPTPSSPTPPPADQPIIISSCGEITKSGKYILARNLLSVNADCLSIYDTTEVHLDCRDYSISVNPNGRGFIPIDIKRVENFSIESCQLKIPKQEPWSGFEFTIKIRDSKNGEIKKNIFENTSVPVSSSTHITIRDNRFADSVYVQDYTTGSIIENNIFSLSYEHDVTPSGMVELNFGSYNQVRGNKINGGAKGIMAEQIRADDGILLQYESFDRIEKNFVENNYDCGIETVGTITDTTIKNNHTKNNGECGIGGWYWSSWKGNVVSENIVENSPKMFQFSRIYGFRSTGWDPLQKLPADQSVIFQDNIFTGNKFVNARVTPFDYPSSLITINLPTQSGTGDVRLPLLSELIVKNNTFSNNDFSTTLKAPLFAPTGMIVDGGGNICAKSSEPDYPLACGRGQ